MRTRLAIFTAFGILAIITLAAAINPPPKQAAGNVPQLFFEYGYPFDLMCGMLNAQNQNPQDDYITEPNMAKARKLLPDIQKIWLAKGQPLLQETVNMFGVGFARKELSATLVICPGYYGVSHPLMINVWGYKGDETIMVNTVFHETLHRFLDDNWRDKLDPQSAEALPLIKKYAAEDGFAVAHIHLFALQEAVYRRAGRGDEWSEILKWAAKIPHPGYQRALEIVRSEGWETLVGELTKNL